MFKQILVGIDGSENSYRALDYARNLAEHYGAGVCLLSAYRRTSDLLGYDDFEKLLSRRKAAGQLILDEARKRLGEAAFTVQEELLEGPPADAILKAARIRKADLIVVGSRGRGALALQDQVAVFQDVAALGELEGQPGVLLHQQNGGALLVDLPQGIEDVSSSRAAQAPWTARPAA
jgi:nucleotide-binding universal stress UspA family protein